MEPVTPGLLRRTRPLAAAAVVLIALWGFGNLYEQVVTAPPGLRNPQPGALVDEFALGSPFWYYVPATPLGVALTWVLAVRLRREPAVEPARWSLRAAVAVTLAALAKASLIVFVNPSFRDPGVTPEAVRDATVTWLWGNGGVIVLLAVGAACLLWWRRVPAAGEEPASASAGQKRTAPAL